MSPSSLLIVAGRLKSLATLCALLALSPVACSDSSDSPQHVTIVVLPGMDAVLDAGHIETGHIETGYIETGYIETGQGEPADVVEDARHEEVDTQVEPTDVTSDAEGDTHSDATHSDATDSDATHSDATHSDATDSDATHSDATDSDATHSDATHSDATHSDATSADDADADDGDIPLPPDCSEEGLSTWTKSESASVGTPDSYFFNVYPGDSFCASITGGGNGTWSVFVSNGRSDGIYCEGSPTCQLRIAEGDDVLIVTAITTDIGRYQLTVQHRPR